MARTYNPIGSLVEGLASGLREYIQIKAARDLEERKVRQAEEEARLKAENAQRQREFQLGLETMRQQGTTDREIKRAQDAFDRMVYQETGRQRRAEMTQEGMTKRQSALLSLRKSLSGGARGGRGGAPGQAGQYPFGLDVKGWNSVSRVFLDKAMDSWAAGIQAETDAQSIEAQAPLVNGEPDLEALPEDKRAQIEALRSNSNAYRDDALGLISTVNQMAGADSGFNAKDYGEAFLRSYYGGQGMSKEEVDQLLGYSTPDTSIVEGAPQGTNAMDEEPPKGGDRVRSLLRKVMGGLEQAAPTGMDAYYRLQKAKKRSQERSQGATP